MENAVGGISEEITGLGKELERDQEKAGMARTAFASTKSEVWRLASKLEGLRERS